MHRLARGFVALVLGLLVGACANRSLPADDAGSGDAGPSTDAAGSGEAGAAPATLTVEGRLCLPPPPTVVAPVKVALLVDTSQSMDTTDPGAQRVQAVKDLVAQWGSLPQVSFVVIAFDSAVRVNGNLAQPGVGAGQFTNNVAVLDSAAAVLKTSVGGTTDIHGALAVLRDLLKKDMASTPPLELPLTRYQLVLLTDGLPSPSCQAGCGGQGDDLAICDSPRDQWCQLLGLTGDTCNTWEASYVALTAACQEYNTESTVKKLAQQIAGLAQKSGAGKLQLHTRALVSTTTPSWQADKLAKLLQDIASIGGGTFKKVASGAAISFADLDLTQLANPYTFGLRSLVLTNTNARLHQGQLEPDSDADGLTDAEELAAGTKPSRADSDADGYGDLLETRLAAQGYDPNDPALPPTPCTDQDQDGDWLGSCEEAALGSDDKRLDSDGDWIPDGLEHVAGTAVNSADAAKDPDGDGVDSATEIRLHTDPLRPDKGSPLGYHYTLTEGAPYQGGGRCYEFTVNNIRTAALVGGADNRLMIHAGYGWSYPQEQGSFLQACVDATGAAATLKIESSAFHPPAKTATAQHPCPRPQ